MERGLNNCPYWEGLSRGLTVACFAWPVPNRTHQMSLTYSAGKYEELEVPYLKGSLTMKGIDGVYGGHAKI